MPVRTVLAFGAMNPVPWAAALAAQVWHSETDKRRASREGSAGQVLIIALTAISRRSLLFGAREGSHFVRSR